MPSITPLHSVKLQSSLDLNNQGLTGTSQAKIFVPKNIGASNKTIDVSDIGRLLKFSGSRTLTFNNNITGVTAGDTFTVTSDSAGFAPAGAATVHDSFADSYLNSITQFIYVGGNTWFKLNIN
jgi:hypothetical protein